MFRKEFLVGEALNITHMLDIDSFSQVSLQAQFKGRNLGHVCGGSIIDENYVLIGNTGVRFKSNLFSNIGLPLIAIY